MKFLRMYRSPVYSPKNMLLSEPSNSNSYILNLGFLRKKIPDAPRSKVDLSKPKLHPHADELLGSIDNIMTNMLNQL